MAPRAGFEPLKLPNPGADTTATVFGQDIVQKGVMGTQSRIEETPNIRHIDALGRQACCAGVAVSQSKDTEPLKQLQEVVKYWDRLAEHVRLTIVELVRK